MPFMVLIVENDVTIAGVVADVLRDEDFEASYLATPQLTAIQEEIALLEPDAVLLDGDDSGRYGQSWDSAAWLHAHYPTMPVIMFTAHAADWAEAQLGETQRSRDAAFAGVVSKPFDLSALLETVGRAVYGHRHARAQVPQPIAH